MCCMLLFFLLLFLPLVCVAVVSRALVLLYSVQLQQFEDIFSDMRAILMFL